MSDGAAAIVLLFVWDGIDRLISKPTKTPSTDGSMTYSFKAQEQATAKAKYIAETEMQAVRPVVDSS